MGLSKTDDLGAGILFSPTGRPNVNNGLPRYQKLGCPAYPWQRLTSGITPLSMAALMAARKIRAVDCCLSIALSRCVAGTKDEASHQVLDKC